MPLFNGFEVQSTEMHDVNLPQFGKLTHDLFTVASMDRISQTEGHRIHDSTIAFVIGGSQGYVQQLRYAIQVLQKEFGQ